ncbi:hypothetical protein DSECCO2_497670 [anaerobic digester metagenome]
MNVGIGAVRGGLPGVGAVDVHGSAGNGIVGLLVHHADAQGDRLRRAAEEDARDEKGYDEATFYHT